MRRNVFTIVGDLIAGLQELRAALQPLAALSGGSDVKGGEAPNPVSNKKRRRRKAKAQSSAGQNVSTNGEMPAAKKSGSKAKARPSATPRAKKHMSPKLRALRVAQGKYLGAIRSLTSAQKAEVKKVQGESGYEAAMKLAGSFKK